MACPRFTHKPTALWELRALRTYHPPVLRSPDPVPRARVWEGSVITRQNIDGATSPTGAFLVPPRCYRTGGWRSAEFAARTRARNSCGTCSGGEHHFPVPVLLGLCLQCVFRRVSIRWTIPETRSSLVFVVLFRGVAGNAGAENGGRTTTALL